MFDATSVEGVKEKKKIKTETQKLTMSMVYMHVGGKYLYFCKLNYIFFS